eukprot:1159230-Pelagomonas_calceolata.AAC.2
MALLADCRWTERKVCGLGGTSLAAPPPPALSLLCMKMACVEEEGWDEQAWELCWEWWCWSMGPAGTVPIMCGWRSCCCSCMRWPEWEAPSAGEDRG